MVVPFDRATRTACVVVIEWWRAQETDRLAGSGKWSGRPERCPPQRAASQQAGLRADERNGVHFSATAFPYRWHSGWLGAVDSNTVAGAASDYGHVPWGGPVPTSRFIPIHRMTTAGTPAARRRKL